MYTEITFEDGLKTIQKNNEDGSTSYIPIDESNSDYQQYLRWLNGEPESIPTIGEINE